MSKLNLDPSNPPRISQEDRARLDALPDSEIERMQANDPDAAPPSDKLLKRGALARRVRLTRERLGLSQGQFAARFRIPAATLRDWEQGRRQPDATSVAYLTVIERNPAAVERALNAA